MPTPAISTEAAIARGIIDGHRQMIDECKFRIEAIVKNAFPEYHFLDYKISTFWDCDKSPAGKCIFILEDGRMGRQCTVCKFCGQPEERK